MRAVVGDLKMPVVTVWSCQTTSRGRPTLRETSFIVVRLDAAVVATIQKISWSGRESIGAPAMLARAGEGLRRTFGDPRPCRCGSGRASRRIDLGRPSFRTSFGG